MSQSPPLPPREVVPDFDALGVVAFTTTRGASEFGLSGAAPVGEVLSRWTALRLAAGVARLASAHQVHGARVLRHGGGWAGWLRADGADGHATTTAETALAVSVADCVPVFLVHPRGGIAVLHAGWRGTVAQMLNEGVGTLLAMMAERGRTARADELRIHLGPAICARCYEVSPDVHQRLTGRAVERPTAVDLRALLADQARMLGARDISVSSLCTRCDNDRLFSHRAGDAERQIGVAWMMPG